MYVVGKTQRHLSEKYKTFSVRLHLLDIYVIIKVQAYSFENTSVLIFTVKLRKENFYFVYLKILVALLIF